MSDLFCVPAGLCTVLMMAAATSCTPSTAATTTTTTTSSTGTTTTAAASLADGLKAAKWGTNVTITYNANGTLRFQSNGLPNHARAAQYAVPNGAGTIVPTAATAVIASDPTRAQTYDFTISTAPVKQASPTSTSLGTIGVMISGAALYNPYEGDGKTVATANNFYLVNSSGEQVAFLDSCNGHPTPMGAYHYHALPPCVTAQVDVAGGPSHIIGIAFDGYPIYGDRDINGNRITAAQLDQCNGITSATPEFPNGVYHYVLLGTADATSSIRCLMGKVSSTPLSMGAMTH